MDDLALKLLLIGLALVLALLLVLGVLIYFWHRQRRRRVHLEKVTVTNAAYESPRTFYSRTNVESGLGAGVKSTASGDLVADKEESPNGFAQVFRGSPTLPPKRMEAPLPPSPVHSPTAAATAAACGESESPTDDHLRSVIVIEELSAVELAGAQQDTALKGDPTSPPAAAKASGAERGKLTLKNRPFKIDLPKRENAEQALSREEELNDGAPAKQSPLTPSRFPAQMERLQENENEKLYGEFEALNQQDSVTSTRPKSTTAELPDNVRRNRFYDVLPYDFNRVKLKGRAVDYINASYVNVEDGSLAYIAAQGPIGDSESPGGRRVSTVADFWLMVWQERVDTIVMLTNCVEGVRQKCASYWPENAGETVDIGGGDGLRMNLYCITEDEVCIQREIWLEKAGAPKRKVMQWQYKDWKDFTGLAGPQHVDALLTFMEAVRQSEKRRPIVVHCSAGVGRTGVYIALDILLDKLTADSPIDVFATVARLRESRASMVQTQEQYVSVYDVIAMAIRRRARSSG